MASEAISNLINNPALLSDPSVLLLAGAVTVSAVALTCYCLPGKKSQKKQKKEKKEEEVADDQTQKTKEKVQDTKKSKKEIKVKAEKKIISVDHPLWVSSVSTGGALSGFAYNGKDLCVGSYEDHTLRLFSPSQQEKVIVKVKDTVTTLAMNRGEEDPKLVAFASFNDSFLLYKLNPAGNNLKIKADFGFEFPKADAEKHKKDIISLELAKSGKLIVTSSEDTVVKVWNAATGSLLAQFNTNQMVNRMVKISPDSRYISVAAFTSDVKVWEVSYKKTGEFDSINKVMDLRGHKSGINTLAFSGDSTRVYTGGKDGVWRMYKIAVRYHIGEDPTLEKSVETGKPITAMEISPDNKVLAIIDKKTVQFWNVATGKLATELDFGKIIENCLDVKWFHWSEDSKQFITVIGQVVYFWKNPVN